jgi:DNA-binding MarR family transcriptional regulator
MKKKKVIISKQQMVTIRSQITGEMEHAKVSVYVEKDIPKYKGEAFTILFQASTFAIGRDISPSASKLLINLVGCVEYNNVISKGVNELAEHMGYSRRQIERAFKELVDYKVLTTSKHPQDKRITQYYLNAIQSWKGKVAERKKFIQKFDPDQLDMFPKTQKEIDASKQGGIEPNENF